MTDQKLRCALISVDPAFRTAVTDIAQDPARAVDLTLDISSSVTDLRRDALEHVRRAEPEVVFLDLGDDPVIGLMFVRALTEDAPELVVVLAGPKLDAEPLLEVMRAGASEYLPKPVEPGDVAGALARVTRKLRGAERRSTPAGRMISVFSAKGGVGASTTATNLAAHLAQSTGKRTLLIDLDVEMGAVALLLGLRPSFSFVDLIENFHRLDEGLLESYVERHPSGLYVLSAPPLADGLTVTRENTRTLLDFVREHFDYVVLDLEKGLSPVSLVGLEQSDLCLVVATPELPTLRNVKRVLPTVERATGAGSEKIRIVLNQYREGLGISVADVQNTLGYEVFFTLERDDAVSHSVNMGKPLVLNGGSKFGKGIKAMTIEITGPEASEVPAGIAGRLRSVFRRREASASATD
jgi:pilus assembly protein CpaE